MANRKQRRAIAEHHHARAQIDKRLFCASRVARIMHINMLHERRGALPNTYIASVFSYLADDLAELQRLINQYR